MTITTPINQQVGAKQGNSISQDIFNTGAWSRRIEIVIIAIRSSGPHALFSIYLFFDGRRWGKIYEELHVGFKTYTRTYPLTFHQSQQVT